MTYSAGSRNSKQKTFGKSHRMWLLSKATR